MKRPLGPFSVCFIRSALCLGLLACNSHAKRILLLPTALDASHIFTQLKVFEELRCRDHGHTVKMVIAEADVPSLSKGTHAGCIEFTTYATPGLKQQMANLVQGEHLPRYTEHARRVQRIWGSACDALLSDEAAMSWVQEFSPDLVVGISVYICTSMLSAKLGVPYVTVTPGGLMSDEWQPWYASAWNFYIPLRLSYSLDQLGRYAPPKSFLDRLRHTLSALNIQIDDYLHTRPYLRSLQRKHGLDMTSKPVRELELMHLVGGDLAIEQPRPLPPKVKLIGPLMPAPAQPLPAELEDFISGAGKEGVILVSLGNHAMFGKREITALSGCFARLPQRVIWKMRPPEQSESEEHKALNLTSNIRVMPWVPQNDILGHESTKAFLSHMGANGLYEAAYHGVPVVAVPFFADQHVNSLKAVIKGFGVILERMTMSEEAALTAFDKVLKESQYIESARRVSRQLHLPRARTPLQEAGDWIERAMEMDGVSYLRTPEEELSWAIKKNA
ncbi:g6067 [Coccomyxa viridis]|uniref:G6067 protein n=1 Tax=Coccomyxa viridis TaxID=1274662 RepID=A0ABP1FUH5_9CHLO